MAMTLVGFFVARFTFQWVVRPRLVDTVTLTLPLTMFGPPDEHAANAGAWVTSSSTVDGAGHVLPSPIRATRLVGLGLDARSAGIKDLRFGAIRR